MTECPCDLCLTPSGCDVCKTPAALRNDHALGITFTAALKRAERQERTVRRLLWAGGATILLVYALWCRALLLTLRAIRDREPVTINLITANGRPIRDARPPKPGTLPPLGGMGVVR